MTAKTLKYLCILPNKVNKQTRKKIIFHGMFLGVNKFEKLETMFYTITLKVKRVSKN